MEPSPEETAYKASIHALPPKGERTWGDIVWYPWNAAKSYVQRVVGVFGIRFLFFLAVSQALLKGLAYSMSLSIMLPLFKTVLGLNATTLQFYMLVVMVPWSVKPVLGLLSDLTLIGGYHKRYWLLQALVSGVTCAGLAFLAYASKSAIGLALCFMGIQFQVALFDLMSESAYSAIMRDKEYVGSDIVTLVQGYQHVGAFASTSMVGLLADHSLFYPMFVILLIVCTMPFVPTILGWLPEEKDPHGVPMGTQSRCGYFFQLVNRDQLRRNRGMIAVIAFTGVAAPLTTIVVELGDPMIGLSFAVITTAFALFGAYVVFPRTIAHIASFQVMAILFRPALGSALDYFYTAPSECLANGPHFSYGYYMTTAGLIGSISGFFGVIIYQACLSGLRFRWVLTITQLLSGAIGASDLFIVMRANIRLGIPDKVAYLMGEAVMEPMLVMLNYIPATALLSKAVPVGMESSAFAFLAGITNYAYMISELNGALIFDLSGVRTSVPCNFDALWWLVIVCHVGLPIVGGVSAAWLFIPNIYQNEKLPEPATETIERNPQMSMSNNHFTLESPLADPSTEDLELESYLLET
jgi:hypothetical protein